MNKEFVLKHGRFGKAQLRNDRGGETNARYGTRQSPKMARVYHEESLSCLRVELEIHAALLRKFEISTVWDLWRLGGLLVPAHIQFVGYRWDRLEAYLVRRFGPKKGTKILREASDRISLQSATRFLSGCGVPNPHRFQSPLRLNRRLQAAIECWASKFLVYEELSIQSR